MSTVRIPLVLRDSTDGQRNVEVAGASVSAALEDLFARHPALRERVTVDGRLSEFINVYLNDRDVRYLDGPDTPVAEGDTIILLPAMAGGAR
jgi:molybdopterin converting factor small subunit